MISKQKIGKIIFSKVLQMPLTKYLTYIEKITKGLTEPFPNYDHQKKTFYAKVMIKNATLYF